MPLGRQGRADALAMQEERDFGAVCLGAPQLGIRGCGGRRCGKRKTPGMEFMCGRCHRRHAR